jgi:hypothetical protein
MATDGDQMRRHVTPRWHRKVYAWWIAGGAIVLAGFVWNPTASGEGARERIPMAARQWIALAMPEIGKGPAGGIKHVTANVNPSNGRIYLIGGDYNGSQFEQSYRQETWSVSLLERWAGGTARNAGWRLEHPYCGSSDGVQPKHPDFVGWTWDAKRSLFWMVPGVMEISNDNCDGETTSRADDPRFLLYHLMTFDPATRRWTDMGRSIGPDVPETWMSVYDPARDEIIRFGFNGGSGAVANILKVATMAWQRIGLSANAIGKDVRINKEYLAADYTHRMIYAIDGVSGRLHRYSMDARRLEDLGPVPGGPIGRENFTLIVWDVANDVLLSWRDDLTKFHAYHPDSKRWEELAITSNVANVGIRGRAMVYDPGQNVTMLFGGLEPPNPYFFLYRFGDGSERSLRKN